jgi:glycosyltransferase involved in cell wall biosynthesis
LNILQVATINKPVTPANGYGPIETVISNLDKGLHARGHRSIVACSGDSTVSGEHLTTVAASLGDYCRDDTPAVRAHIDLHLRKALQRSKQPDINVVHMHEWFERVYDGSFNPAAPIVMTMHVPGARSGISEYRQRKALAEGVARDLPVIHGVAISEFQRRQYDGLLPIVRTIPHGIDASDHPFGPFASAVPYLFNIGRITPDKGQDTAIAVARRTGATLIIAGCVQNKPADQAFFRALRPQFDFETDLSRVPVADDYYDRVMKPLLASGRGVIYVGELSGNAAKQWYRHAQATLFPIRWGEPFGMVLIESMAAGTPVIAFGEGAVPEIVKHGSTGFVVDSIASMCDAVANVMHIRRESCRQHVEVNFSSERMAAAYEGLYLHLARGPFEVSRARTESRRMVALTRPAFAL